MSSVQQIAHNLKAYKNIDKVFIYDINIDTLEILRVPCKVRYEYDYKNNKLKYFTVHQKYQCEVDIDRTAADCIKEIDDYFNQLSQAQYAVSELSSFVGDYEFGHWWIYLIEEDEDLVFESIEHVIDGLNKVLEPLPMTSKLKIDWAIKVKNYIMSDLEVKKIFT